MQLPISRIEIRPLSIPLVKPFVISLGPFYSADNVIIKIHTAEGIVGTGECSPFQTIHGETQASAILIGESLAKFLVGKDATDIQGCVQLLDGLIYGNWCLKSAFDMALHDIAAQAKGQPLFQFLGGTKRNDLFTDYTVSIGKPEQMAEDAADLKSRGFKVIKVKLGNAPLDIERIKAIRNAIGYDIALRVDANQGWSPSEAQTILKSLADQNIQFCEEPIKRGQYKELAAISQQSPIPIMADESCCTPYDLQNLIDSKSCTMVNVKLGKAGGLFHAGRMLQMAEKAKLPVQLSGFLESRLGFTATTHLACSSENVQYCDFDTPLMFSSDPVSGGIGYGPNWEIEVPDKSGMGAHFL